MTEPIKDQQKQPPKEIDAESEENPFLQPVKAKYNARSKYDYLDGLRGIGALAVYIQHFYQEFYTMNRQPTDPALQKDYPHKPPAWIAFVLDTPIYIIMAGNFWVFVFFILSGFVLPLSWFRTRKPESITGAVFRRYIRLMIPYFITISFYYFVAKMDLTSRKKSLAAVKKKSYLQFFLDGTVGVWWHMMGEWMNSSWTMHIELIASYYVFVVSETLLSNKRRWIFYLFAFSFFYVPRMADDFLETKYGYLESTSEGRGRVLLGLRWFLPIFTFGILFADLETLRPTRPLDTIRNWPIWAKIIFNTLLIVIFILYGSIIPQVQCEARPEEDQKMCQGLTFKYHISYTFSSTFGAICVFVLALTSEGFQWFLNSPPIHFLGQISFTLYLMHTLFVTWAEYEFHAHLVENNYDYDYAVYITFILFTPILFFASWLSFKFVDQPATKFAGEIDQATRLEFIDIKTKKPAKRESCWEFCKGSWKFWTLTGYLLGLLIVTEIYQYVRSPDPGQDPHSFFDTGAPKTKQSNSAAIDINH